MKLKPFSLFAMFPVLMACGSSTTSSPSASTSPTEGNEAPGWNADCVAVRGCGEVQTLSPCSEAGSAMDLATAQSSAAGSTVTVRAYLTQSPGMMTLMGCAEGACCNHASAALVLTSTPMTQIASAEVPQLRLDGESFVCRGDDSGICCNYRVDASGPEVVVTGTLVGEPGAIALQPSSICTL